MARIVNSDYIPSIALHARTILESGSEIDTVLKEDTMVTDLRYIENEEIKKATGRISRIGYTLKPVSRQYKNVNTAKSYFETDVTPTEIDVDCSTEYHSNVVTIPVREIIEFEGVTDVERMKCGLSYAVNVAISLTDGTTQDFVIEEGQQLIGLTYLDRGGDETVDAKVVAFRYNKILEPTAMIFITNNKIKEIDIEAIKSVEAVVTPVTPTTDTAIADAIAASTTGSVYLNAATFIEAVSVTSDITIVGAKAGIPANNLNLRNETTESQETVLSGKIEVAKGASLTLDGLTLTGDSYISAKKASSVTLKNCRILGLNPTSKTSSIINSGTEEMKVDIQNCYFGDNQVVGDNVYYNLLNITATIADGSIIANNYFAESVCTHNCISMYHIAENANLIISKNVWEKSANAIRIGFYGNPTCVIDIDDNTYLSTDDENPDYAGLLLIQPANFNTTGMENMIININNTIHTDKHQLYYLYAGAKDMQFDEYNIPTIIVDGKVEMTPIARPVVEEPVKESTPETTV